MQFHVKSWIDASVLFTAEIDADENTSYSVMLGLAVKWAIKARANLTDANLYGANLYGANLYGANLTGADLTRADLTRASLYGANLTRADLTGANLYGANLTDADLTRADLTGADLTRADLTRAKNGDLIVAQTRILPEGDLIGWKKCQKGVIVKLKVPTKAKRSHAFGRKCRAEYVKVLEVFGADVGISTHDGITKYKKGATVCCDQWDDDWQNECAGGIHFFITRIEAENY